MSADAAISVPIKLLLEGISHTVTVEMKNGESYRGELADAEQCMNLKLNDVMHTARNGAKKRLEHVYVRGANVKLVIFPDMLKEATIFRKVVVAKKIFDSKEASRKPGKGRGRGYLK